MATTSKHFAATPVTCHSFNKDCTEVAISLNNHEVEIYGKKGADWELTATLKQHEQRVTSVDWAPISNMIVTCGVDRNSYVWTRGKDSEWKPSLVILRLNRAATSVRWSPKENKFAVGTGGKIICVCHYDEGLKWWASKHIKKPLSSTVLGIDWHPNNCIIAAACADFKTRVFSAYMKDIDEKPEGCAWGKKMTWGTVMREYSNSAWAHSVSFSPSGDKLAWVSHDSTVSVYDAAAGNLQVVKMGELPFLTCLFFSEQSIITAGHGCFPALFCLSAAGKLEFKQKLMPKAEAKSDSKAMGARKMFEGMDKRGTTTQVESLDTIHQNSITQLSRHLDTRFATSGADGHLVIWNTKAMSDVTYI